MKVQHALIASAAGLLLAGCADYGYGPDYYSADYYGAPAAYYGPGVDIDFDGFYDGYYGPIYDGYWNSGAFYYRSSPDAGYVRGNTAHFRHTAAPGFNHIRGTTHMTAPARRPPD
jgi:hypothetical protein